MTLDLDRLEALAKDAPQGKWEIWTSNSWRRIYADQGREKVRVIEPAVHSDGWPDLMFGPGVEAWMEGFTSEVALALIAEVRALRAELNTPLLTGAYAPMYDGIFAAEGINHDVAMSAFYENAPTVTVYYGRRHVYTCMAEFCAEYSKEPT